MTARDLKIVMPGDKIKFKKGWMHAGCHATFIRFVPGEESLPITGRIDGMIEYEFADKIMLASHYQFTLKK